MGWQLLLNLLCHFFIVIGDLRVLNGLRARYIQLEREFRTRKASGIDDGAIAMRPLEIGTVITDNNQVWEGVKTHCGIEIPVGWHH
jgi:hypothetical protein